MAQVAKRAGISRTAAWLAMGAVLLLAACSKEQPFERAPEPGDKAVATVNGHTVWTSDVKREAVAQGMISEGEPLDASSDLFRQVLDEVVDQKLLAAEALRRKMDKDPLAQRRLAAARERILGDMLVESVVDKAVNENAINTLYQEQLKLSKQTDEFHARQIVTATQADADQVKKLLASGADFSALAMERSIDPNTRFNGGDLGYFTTDVMPEAYGAALKDAKVGDVIGPFQVEGGWAVAKVEDRRPESPISLEQARPQIVRFLTYDEVRDLLERLRSKARVKVLVHPAQGVPGSPTEPASAPPSSLLAPGQAPSGAPAASAAPAPATPPASATAPAPSAAKPALRGAGTPTGHRA
jgi:peptidyl-prolyl cis-trans isomerase C